MHISKNGDADVELKTKLSRESVTAAPFPSLTRRVVAEEYSAIAWAPANRLQRRLLTPVEQVGQASVLAIISCAPYGWRYGRYPPLSEFAHAQRFVGLTAV